MAWNNTGVYKNFACAAGAVSVPKSMQAIEKKGNWSVYSGPDNVTTVVYTIENFGLLAVFEDVVPAAIFEKVLGVNSDLDLLHNQFQFPDGPLLKFDVKAKKEQWVMISEDGQNLNRDFDSWPLIDGDL
jgi:hypothetical protein